MTPLLDHAMKYAARGWAVLPLRGKLPRTEHGVKDATKDLDQIRRWWEVWPDANIGVATGEDSGIIALDLDGPEGEKSINGKYIPPAPQQRTGKGTHYIFNHPGRSVGNKVRLLPGIDIRGDGGYVVMAPSIHPSGAKYEWTIPPDQEAPPPMPEWLLALCEKHPSPATGQGVGEKIQSGGRNDTLFRQASWMRGKGWGVSAILAALLQENKDRCEPPLSEDEVRRIAESVARFPEGKPEIRPVQAAVETLPLVISLGEFLETVLPPREYVLAPWFLEKNVAMVYGIQGHGKTWITLGVSAAVAAGGQFLQWSAPKARKVLFVDGELSAEELQDKFLTLIPSMRLADDKATVSAANLQLMTPDILRRCNVDPPNILDPKGQAFIEKFMDGTELLVLDNLSTLARGGEENAAESWQTVQDWLISLRGRGVNVIFAHHANAQGGQRGTTKRTDILDYTLNVKETPEKDKNDGARFIVSFIKTRGKHKDPRAFTPFEAWLTRDESGPVWTITDMAEELHRRIVQMYKDGITNQRDIADALGTSKPTVCRTLQKARKNGEL